MTIPTGVIGQWYGRQFIELVTKHPARAFITQFPVEVVFDKQLRRLKTSSQRFELATSVMSHGTQEHRIRFRPARICWSIVDGGSRTRLCPCPACELSCFCSRFDHFTTRLFALATFFRAHFHMLIIFEFFTFGRTTRTCLGARFTDQGGERSVTSDNLRSRRAKVGAILARRQSGDVILVTRM